MFKRKSRDQIHTLIDAGTRIHGDVEFAGGLRVDGCVHGDVRAYGEAPSFLSVSAEGRIEGSVSADDVVVNGVVTGDIRAVGRVRLGATARVHGNVRYALIESAVGAQINGKLVHRADGAGAGPDSAPQGGAPGDAEPEALIGHRRAG